MYPNFDSTVRSLRRKPQLTGQLGIYFGGQWYKLPLSVLVKDGKLTDKTLAEYIEGDGMFYISLDARHARVYEPTGDQLQVVDESRAEDIYVSFSQTLDLKRDVSRGDIQILAEVALECPRLLDGLSPSDAKAVKAYMENSKK